eukprot:gnl/MRDRNA2_/MRDRNA2_280617_c0_seq1.p1 gnl/MRDRNA2_/MRDRNA2_280617_c0~~gnl/MRDRNA2_/MRDRNA2_280617_c0_seq1.p1  ORF type:complete len:112 (+),score=11.35 gnl/MRDRNA2_/MRDRNA2_280617_c0_seq1:164-499(+)
MLSIALTRQVMQCVLDFKPRHLTLTAGAFAKASQVDTDLFRALAYQTRRCLHHFDSKDLDRAIRAFAKVGHFDAELFTALACATEQFPGAVKPRNLANTAWDFAATGQSGM